MSDETFSTNKVKESYWMNWYSPFGNFEDVLILPVIYVGFISGFLSLLNSFDSIGVCIVFGFSITYDLIKKINKQN